jgi:hypothetical protein
MSNIVTVGYITEGSTDRRFLETIIKKTIDEIAFQCDGEINVYDPIFLEIPKTQNFIEKALSAAKLAFTNGVFILCVHTDADDFGNSTVMTHKINPAIAAIQNVTQEICKNIVPIIPITMSEAWMLADKELFKNEIGTILSDEELNINKHPEKISNPKTIIEEALRISQSNLPKRRFKLTIGDIYQPLGQKLTIEKLNHLDSFKNFRLSVENAFKALNYLH